MSEPHVTITLGRTGQVVKRGRSKRFLGSDGFLSTNKRPRVDHAKWRPGDHRFDDLRIARNDLRLKLMWKRRVEEQRKRVHEKMLKTGQPPSDAKMLRSHPQAKQSGFLRKYPSKEVLNDLHPQDTLRKYYSSRNRDGFRDRSPGRIQTSVELSPLQQVPAVSRAGRYFSNGVVAASRQRASNPINMRATTEAAHPVGPSGGIRPKSPLMGAEHLTVSGVLQSLGLGKYAITFQAEEVDMPALKQMNEKDLKELGIPMGPRKKILLAVKPRSKPPPP